MFSRQQMKSQNINFTPAKVSTNVYILEINLKEFQPDNDKMGNNIKCLEEGFSYPFSARGSLSEVGG